MIDHYELLEVLGTGSFATVWLARDTILDRKVAVKVLADNWSVDNEIRRRFVYEANITIGAESPRIVRGYSVGETDDGQPYLVMADADRGTLEARLDEYRRGERPRPTVAEACELVREITLAIAEVHRLGHLHRDIKPSNVLFATPPNGHGRGGVAERVMLADFGLARGIDSTALTLVSGSPGYVAPEQAAGLDQLTAAADLYPLGLILLELLTGDAATSSTTIKAAAERVVDVDGMLARARSEGTLADGELRPELTALLKDLVAADPDDRPAAAVRVAERLAALVAGRRAELPPPPPQYGPAAATPAPRPDGRARPTGGLVGSLRQPPVLVGGGVLLALLIAVLIWQLSGDDPNPPVATGASTVASPVATGRSPATSPSSAPATTTPIVVATVPDGADFQYIDPEGSLSAPVPDIAVLQRSSERTESQVEGGIYIAEIALPIEQTIEFYRGVDGWEVVAEPVDVTEPDTPAGSKSFTIEKTDDGYRAELIVSPIALSAGADITQIRAIPVG